MKIINQDNWIYVNDEIKFNISNKFQRNRPINIVTVFIFNIKEKHSMMYTQQILLDKDGNYEISNYFLELIIENGILKKTK